MSKKWHYSEEQIKEAEERSARIREAFLNGLRKAQSLGIQDMTSLEAEAYLKKKEEEEKKKLEEEKKD